MPVSHGSGSYSPYMELPMGKTMTSPQQVVWESPNHRCLQCSVFWHFGQIDQLATAGYVGPWVLKGEGRQTGGCELPYSGQDSITAHLSKRCGLLSSLNPLMVSPQPLFRVLGKTNLPPTMTMTGPGLLDIKSCCALVQSSPMTLGPLCICRQVCLSSRTDSSPSPSSCGLWFERVSLYQSSLASWVMSSHADIWVKDISSKSWRFLGQISF